MSGVSKLGALCVTYPYQAIRLRIHVRSLLRDCTVLMRCRSNRRWRACIIVRPRRPSRIHGHMGWGVAGFYHGLTTNLVRVLPGMCHVCRVCKYRLVV